VAAVHEDQRQRTAADHDVGRFLTVPDPRRRVLEASTQEVCSISIVVENR
jgi:hypothetical protein